MSVQKTAKRVALFDNDGIFAGVDSDYGAPPPHNSTYTIPECKEGFIPKWNGKAWSNIENHKGCQGFVDGKPFTVSEYGPLPEGWSKEYVDPRPASEIRKGEILGLLSAIDRKKIRPLCALVNGGTEDDKKVLADLEVESALLREELASLL